LRLRIYLKCSNLSDQPEPFRAQFAGGAILSLEVDDAQAALTSFSAQGVPIVVALRDEPWGQRHFAVRDPNGIMIDVVQTIDATPEFQALYVQP
jgi:uncharacterized glyoxalase superfamily protein PhnB